MMWIPNETPAEDLDELRLRPWEQMVLIALVAWTASVFVLAGIGLGYLLRLWGTGQ